MQVRNLFEDIPSALPDELSEEIVRAEGVRIERIVSRGHATREDHWYDQHEDEWVLLVSGSAGIAIEGRAELVVLAPGDHFSIPARCRHRVAWTDARHDTVWLAVFSPPFDAPGEGEAG